MQREELAAREEFTYSHMPTLERGGSTLGRRGDRGAERKSDRGERDRPERDSYTVDVRASDLQLAQPEPLKHPCFSYRAWLYSVLIGVRGKMRESYKVDTTQDLPIFFHNTQMKRLRQSFSDDRICQS